MVKPVKRPKSDEIPRQPRKHKKNLKTKKIKKTKLKPGAAAAAAPAAAAPAPPPELLTTASQQLDYFLEEYQSANGVQLSPLELESFTEACFLKLSESLPQDDNNLSEHVKASFGPSWKEVLCKKQFPGRISEPGSPALLVISLSALRSLEVLRSLKPFTKECRAAKLFSKHLKIEDQVSSLKSHVNVACGTPSRIKKLIDMEALGLSRLAVVLLDMQPNVKGYSLLSLPQIRDEFWDLYKTYFHQRILDGNLRICLYGSVVNNFRKSSSKKDAIE